LIGACVEPPCIITQFCENGSLFDFLHNQKKFKVQLENALLIAKDIAEGVAMLHALKPPIIHRDLSTGNIVMDFNLRPLIIDFGISREEVSDVPTHLSPIGHPRLRAPEISQRKPYTKSLDVYNFGTVLYELATLKIPFEELPDSEVVFCTSRGITPPLPDTIPKSLRKLIIKCWELTPEKRPTFKQISHKLKKIYDKLMGWTSNTSNPVSRPGSGIYKSSISKQATNTGVVIPPLNLNNLTAV